jgi:hypothetical protein
MKKLIIFFGYTVFLAYWGITIFFTLPENYLQIKAIRYEKLFSTFLYQRWSFFAPPPQTNDRLYYEFCNEKDTVSFEVLKPLNDQRRREFLRNANASVIDYVLSGSISGITDGLREEYKLYKFKNCNSNSDTACQKAFMDSFEPKTRQMNHTKTLINYGLVAADKKLNLKKFDKMRFTISTVNIPKFSKRNEENIKLEESQLFQSSYYNYNTKKWEK